MSIPRSDKFDNEIPDNSQSPAPNLTELPLASQPASQQASQAASQQAWICKLNVWTQTRKTEIKMGFAADPVEIHAEISFKKENATDKVETEHLEDILADVIDQFAKIRDCEPDSMEDGLVFKSRIVLISEEPLPKFPEVLITWFDPIYLDPRYLDVSEGLRPFMLHEMMNILVQKEPKRLHTGFY